MRLVLLTLVLAAGFADDPGRVRAALGRVREEARVARLHPQPEDSREHARAAARFAHQVGRAEGGQALGRAADALADAAMGGEPEAVRAAALAVEAEVRRVDEALPAPEKQ